MSIVETEKYYLSLDTRYADDVNSDNTKCTWYLKNLLSKANLKKCDRS